MTSGNRFAAVLCLAIIIDAGCSTNGGIKPIRTMVARAEDGASASIDVDASLADAIVQFSKVADADGLTSDDRKNVSGTYLLNFTGSAAGDAVLTIPLAADLLPDQFQPVSLAVERLDPLTGRWLATASLTDYDPKSRELSFVVPVDASQRLNDPRSLDFASRSITTADMKYRVGLALWTDAKVVRIPGSLFEITYYPHAVGKDWTVMEDSAWASTSGHATDLATPDYIEDLDAALNDAYMKLLALKDENATIFSPLTDEQRQVFVESCGESAGLSPMGGPMKISASQIRSFDDMKGVAGHELVHVFQGQFFLTGRTGRLAHLVAGVGSWLWFIEGSANYFSARALSLVGAARDTLYGRNEDGKYMSLGLSAGNDQSYYMTAHFLDFITERSGTGVVPAILRSGSASRSTTALSRALIDSPRGDGIGLTLESYAQELVTKPEAGNGMHLHLVANLLNHQMDADLAYLSGTSFSNSTTFLTMKRQLPPLSLAYVEARDTTAADALLVIEALPANPASVATFTWDRVGTGNAAFTDALPLEDYSGKTMTVKDFGAGRSASGFSQIIVNNDLSSHHEIDFKYYILIPLPIIGHDEGSVTIETSHLGNIPSNYIRELRLLRMTDAGTYQVIARFQPAGMQTVVSNPSIDRDDLLEVQTVDRHGNEWPVFDMGEPVTLWIGCHDAGDDGEGWGCVKLDWTGNDTATTAFIDASTSKCLLSDYRQYYGVTFEQEADCRSWCDNAAGGGDSVCRTPGEGGNDMCGSIEPGNDFCQSGECWNCCEGCDGKAVYLYSCMDGCQTGVIEIQGKPVVVCECS